MASSPPPLRWAPEDLAPDVDDDPREFSLAGHRAVVRTFVVPDALTQATHASRAFRHVRARGLPLPLIGSVVCASTPSSDAICVVSHPVEGVPLLSALENDRPKAFANAEQAVDSLIAHYAAVAEEGGPYLVDVHARQFIYGRTKRDPTPRSYFVDLDPVCQQITQQPDDLMRARFAWRLADVSNLILDIEAAARRPLSARRPFLDLLNRIDGRWPAPAWTASIRDALDDGRRLDGASWVRDTMPQP